MNVGKWRIQSDNYILIFYHKIINNNEYEKIKSFKPPKKHKKKKEKKNKHKKKDKKQCIIM